MSLASSLCGWNSQRECISGDFNTMFLSYSLNLGKAPLDSR